MKSNCRVLCHRHWYFANGDAHPIRLPTIAIEIGISCNRAICWRSCWLRLQTLRIITIPPICNKHAGERKISVLVEVNRPELTRILVRRFFESPFHLPPWGLPPCSLADSSSSRKRRSHPAPATQPPCRPLGLAWSCRWSHPAPSQNTLSCALPRASSWWWTHRLTQIDAHRGRKLHWAGSMGDMMHRDWIDVRNPIPLRPMADMGRQIRSAWIFAPQINADAIADTQRRHSRLTCTTNLSLGHCNEHAQSMIVWHTIRSLNMGSWTATLGYKLVKRIGSGIGWYRHADSGRFPRIHAFSFICR